jgi:hypothetical protein
MYQLGSKGQNCAVRAASTLLRNRELPNTGMCPKNAYAEVFYDFPQFLQANAGSITD